MAVIRRFAAIWVILLFGSSPASYAYSVLTHEAVIDSAWDTKIRPLLLARFPNATPDDLRRAHAFAYGGAIIQDLGYYPRGSHYFSDLAHYVRSGDFVRTMILDSRDLNEYAFALGALAHYAGDNFGHPIAVNRAVPRLYPKLEKKYGPIMTYEENPAAHLKTEFGFDVLEVAKGRYAPDNYHDFIGFEVSKLLLERAFQDTYSIPLQDTFKDFDKAIGSYRYTIRVIIPKATKIAWALKDKEIEKDRPGMTRRKFLYNISRASYQREWGNDYSRPGLGDKVLAFVIWLLPKVGPLRDLTFRTPTAQTETMLMASFNAALSEYERLLDEQRDGHLDLPNTNFDTGSLTMPGTYFMADQAYADLVHSLTKDEFKQVSPALRTNVLDYYSDSTAPIVTKKNRKKWKRLNGELEQLKTASPSSLSNALPSAGVR